MADLETVVLLSAFFALVAVLPAGVARLVRRRRTLLAAMHRRNEQLHSEQSEIARQAQARERTRIARDLHDSLGHTLTLTSLYAGMARAAGEDARESARLLEQTSSAAMAAGHGSPWSPPRSPSAACWPCAGPGCGSPRRS